MGGAISAVTRVFDALCASRFATRMGYRSVSQASPSSAMLTPATFAYRAARAAPDDRAVSTLRIFLERVAQRNRGRGSSKLRRATSCQIAGSYRNGCTLPFRGDLQEISKTFKTGCRWASSLTSRLRLGTPEFTCCRGVLNPPTHGPASGFCAPVHVGAHDVRERQFRPAILVLRNRAAGPLKRSLVIQPRVRGIVRAFAEWAPQSRLAKHPAGAWPNR